MMEVLHIPRQHIGYATNIEEYSAFVEVWLTAVLTDCSEIKLHVKATRDSVWGGYWDNGVWRNGTWGSYADTIKIPQDSSAQTIKAAYQFDNGTVEYDFYVPVSAIGQTAAVHISGVDGVFTVAGEMFIGASSISASDGYFGSACRISLTALTTEAKHTLSVSCGGIEKTLLNKSASTTATWTPTVAEYAPMINNAKSATATISCTTYIGEAEVGSRSISVTMSFKDADVMPGLSMWVGDDTGILSTYGKFISGQSRYKIILYPTMKYAASLQSVKIVTNGKTYTNRQTITEAISDATVTAKVTDSRGVESALCTVTNELYSYQSPSVSIIEAYHCRSDGTRDASGQYLAVKAAATMTSLDGQNTLAIRAQVKAFNSSGEYMDAGALINNTATVLNGTWGPDTSWLIKAIATDRLENSAEMFTRLSTRVYALHVKEGVTGAAIGKAAEYDSVLELPEGWRIKIGDNYWP